MHRIILFTCLIFIVLVHYFAFSFFYEKKEPENFKPKYSKVSVQLASLSLPKPVIKKIEKPIKKKIEKKILKKKIKKKVFKKPIKKQAKREFVKKEIKKSLKKEPLKKEVKKLPKEKILKQKVTKKDKVLKKVAKKVAALSLKKIKKFKNSYKNALRKAIDKNKKYPRISRKFKEEGLVKVSFRVLKSGLFTNIELITSSGKKRLDKAALKALYLTGSFQAFPKELKAEFIDFNLPMKFKLRN